MRNSPTVIGLLAGLIVIAATTAGSQSFAQGASRTRPSGSSGSMRATSGGSHSSVGVSHGSPTRASGRATYGYGSYRGGGRHYGGHYGRYYGGYYGGFYGGYGYRRWGHYYPYYGYWGSPWYYGGYAHSPSPYYPVATGRLRQPPAVVETTVKPKKAEVFLDGDLIGQARDYNGSWDVLYVKPGRHEIEFRKDGLMTLHYAVDVSSGGYYQLDEKMQKGEGLDPRSIVDFPERQAPASSSPPESRPTEFDGRFGAEARTEAVPPSNLRSGLLRLDVSPTDAAVYLDGEFLAQADELRRLHGALPVAAGSHIVEIVRPGYTSERRQIEVRDGDVAKVVIQLSQPESSP